MGNFNFKLNMFKLAALTAVAAAADMDVPKEYQWVNKCDWEGAPYEKYAHFKGLEKYNDNRDACLLIGAHIFAVADLDTSLTLDKCEWSYGCLAFVIDSEDPTEDEFLAAGKKCAKLANKTVPKGGVTLPDVGKACAEEFPTLEGSPFDH